MNATSWGQEVLWSVGACALERANSLGPPGAGMNPLASQLAASQVAEDRQVSEGYWQAAGHHSGGSTHAGNPTPSRGQDF